MDKDPNYQQRSLTAPGSFDSDDTERSKLVGAAPFRGASPRALHLEDAVKLKKAWRLQALLEFNQMTRPVVSGILREGKADGYPFWLEHLQTADGHRLRLPLVEEYRDPAIPLNQIPLNSNIGGRFRIEIDVVGDSSPEVTARGRPFALRSVGSPEAMSLIHLPLVVREGSDVLVEKSIWESELKKLQYPLQVEFDKFKLKMDQDLQSMLDTNRGLEQEAVEKNAALVDLDAKVTDSKQHLLAIEADIDVGLECIEKVKKQREEAMAAYQEMSDFARDRASILQTLDLISEEQFSKLTGGRLEPPSDEDHLSWEVDLGKQYGKAVSSIHAFLLSQGMIYPRWLIGDFLTLLRMNDLIILSGLSGAGKTQIVRSFAQAMGGVAHIIPVKPNWTGAEDLLGFFNPLQKSYVRTPFLEALLAASNDPNRLHLICLDEMNLARAEYYFADFLSAQEDRNKPAEISLYSESEASHIQAEVRLLLAALRGIESDQRQGKNVVSSIEDLIQRPEFMERLRSMFGENAGESFPVFHGRVRRSLSTVLDIPSKIVVTANVRFIGAINVDQTTYGLSPKILDRAHVIRFDNPLKHSIEDIGEEAARHMSDVPRVAPIQMHPEAFFPVRGNYPQYVQDHPAAKWLLDLYRDYLEPLGIDVAFRTVRQAQLFWDLHAEVAEGSKEERESDAKNLIFLQKILPKFTMDGKTKVRFRNEPEPKMRTEIVRMLEQDLKATAGLNRIYPNMHEELHRIRLSSDSSDKIFNYWA